jgi:hypothetical protein
MSSDGGGQVHKGLEFLTLARLYNREQAFDGGFALFAASAKHDSPPLTRVDSAFAGRAYAAYGGIYIAASLTWLWVVEGQRPSGPDLAGSGLAVIGALVIIDLAPRQP